MMSPLFALLLLSAELPSLAVIPVIAAEDASAPTATAITEEIAAAARGRAIRVLTHEDLFVAANSELVEEVRACGPDEACMSSRLSEVRVELGVIVVVSAVADPPIVAVRLVDVRERRVVAAAIGPLAVEEKTIAEAIRMRAAKLFEERGFKKAIEVVPPPAPAVVEEASSPWLWIGIGAAVIAIGVGAAVIATQSGPSACICVGPRDDCPPC